MSNNEILGIDRLSPLAKGDSRKPVVIVRKMPISIRGNAFELAKEWRSNSQFNRKPNAKTATEISYAAYAETKANEAGKSGKGKFTTGKNHFRNF